MRVAICCPGQSLPITWKGRDGHALVYAVNRALRVVDADWLVAGDIGLFQTLLGDFRPKIGSFTMESVRHAYRNDRSWGIIETWEESPGFNAHRPIRPINWSVQAAMVHAADKGATIIDLYGCDCRNRLDCTGYEGENRGDDRWAREEIDIAATLSFLSARGVMVNRIRPPHVE